MRSAGRPLSSKASPVPGKPGEFEFDLGGHFPVDRVNFELPELNSVVDVRLFSRAGAESRRGDRCARRGFYRVTEQRRRSW